MQFILMIGDRLCWRRTRYLSPVRLSLVLEENVLFVSNMTVEKAEQRRGICSHSNEEGIYTDEFGKVWRIQSLYTNSFRSQSTSTCQNHLEASVKGTFRLTEGFSQMLGPKNMHFRSTPKFETHYYVLTEWPGIPAFGSQREQSPTQMVLKIMNRRAGRGRNQQGGEGAQTAATAGSHGTPWASKGRGRLWWHQSPVRIGAGRKGNQEGQSLPTAMLHQGRSTEENPSCFLFQSSDFRPTHHVSQSQVRSVRKPGKFGLQDREGQRWDTEQGRRDRARAVSTRDSVTNTSISSKLNDSGQGQIWKSQIPPSLHRLQKRTGTRMLPISA